MAAFVVAAPYVSSGLKWGYSALSGSSENGPGISTSTATTQCSSSVQVQNLVSPAFVNGSAVVSYPPDYCSLAAYTLGLINQDRAANGTGPVSLDYNTAAQQHADSMLYYGYFSHFDTQGYKPYMRYTLLGGVGGDSENVAYFGYSGHFTSTAAVESAVKTLEHDMVYNDSDCCANGHRYNILDSLHNQVSVGFAYDSDYVYFVEEFENNYINLNLTVTGASSSNPYDVTMTGVPIQGAPTPSSIYITFDTSPSPETTAQLNNGPHEYGPGTLEGGVLPCSKLYQSLGHCPVFSTGTTVYADTWTFTTRQVDIAFSLQAFIKKSGPGVYTVYLITGKTTESAITSISIFVS
jgi:uncharacterized protein YkwD